MAFATRDFQVNINSVLGSGVKNPEDALTIAHRCCGAGLQVPSELFMTITDN